MSVKLAFAKEIQGGYKIVSLFHSPYAVTRLPQNCEKTGFPVLFSPNAYDAVEGVGQMISDHVQRVVGEVAQVLQRFTKEAIQHREASGSLPENFELRLISLGYQGASALISRTIIKSLQKDATAGPILANVVAHETAEVATDLAREDGHYIPDASMSRQQAERSMVDFISKLFGVHPESVMVVGEDGKKFVEKAKVSAFDCES
jgi:hypothetical protein